jgi:hypothetical protein
VNPNNDAVREATNSIELETAIQEHVSSDSLYEGELSILKRLEDTSRIEAVLNAFPVDFSF